VERRILIKGDKTTAGGVILEGVAAFNEDEALAFHGAKIWCPACKSEGTLCNDGPHWPTSFDGKEVGVENDLCICKCVPPPRLIASQDGMLMAFEPHELASMGYHPDGAPIVAAASMVSAAAAAAFGGNRTSAADGSANTSTPLSDAKPFEYANSTTGGSSQAYAARGVSEEDESECNAEYERDMDLCKALSGPMGGARGLALCQQNAFLKYQQCRGF